MGVDRSGAQYIFIPQFLPSDIRIYKQNLNAKTWIEKDKEYNLKIKKEKVNIL